MFTRNFLIIFLCATSFLKAQNKLIVVSENGEPFWLYVNQQKVNDSAQVIVKSGKLMDDSCRVNIQFFDKKLNNINTVIFLLQNGKSCKDIEFTYAIEITKKNTELKFISTDSINKQSQASKRVKDFLSIYQKEQENKNKLTENYPLPTNCISNINDSMLTKQINYLKTNHIEINRVKDAKWFISNNCLSIPQMEKIFDVFDYEDSKLRLAKFGYDYLFDKENFLNILNSLKYKTEKEELKKFYSEKTKK